jgi:hypothetical protein
MAPTSFGTSAFILVDDLEADKREIPGREYSVTKVKSSPNIKHCFLAMN